MQLFNFLPSTVTTMNYQNLAQRLPLQILLAEDGPIERSICLSILEEMGYEVTAVKNGLEILQALQYQNYDLILMDMWMPKMDGIATARAILNIYSYQMFLSLRPRLIGMTVVDNHHWYETYLSFGIDDCIIKPIQINQLQMTLEKWGNVNLATHYAQEIEE
jgi:CheY-like chemotaxis protein